MRTSLFALGLVLASGCHKLFDLEAVDRPGDGGVVSDGRTTDTTIVQLDVPTGACPITPVVYDEDLDSIDDRCDACPTVASDASDSDSDGLPNACDQDFAGTGDTILLAATFAQEGDFTNNFTATGATWSAGSRGRVHLDSDSKLETLPLFAPTRIVVRVSGFAGSARASTLAIEMATAACQISAGPCSDASGSAMCVSLKPATTSTGAELGGATSTLVEIDLAQASANVLRCTLRGNGATNVNDMLTLGVGTVSVSATLGATVDIESIVIYGAK